MTSQFTLQSRNCVSYQDSISEDDWQVRVSSKSERRFQITYIFLQTFCWGFSSISVLTRLLSFTSDKSISFLTSGRVWLRSGNSFHSFSYLILFSPNEQFVLVQKCRQPYPANIDKQQFWHYRARLEAYVCLTDGIIAEISFRSSAEIARSYVSVRFTQQIVTALPNGINPGFNMRNLSDLNIIVVNKM